MRINIAMVSRRVAPKGISFGHLSTVKIKYAFKIVVRNPTLRDHFFFFGLFKTTKKATRITA